MAAAGLCPPHGASVVGQYFELSATPANNYVVRSTGGASVGSKAATAVKRFRNSGGGGGNTRGGSMHSTLTGVDQTIAEQCIGGPNG
jgi:hypothetical protein